MVLIKLHIAPIWQISELRQNVNFVSFFVAIAIFIFQYIKKNALLSFGNF